MKFLLFRKFFWVILFTLVHIWFMIFNWQLFITMLNVNLGFGVIRLPPFVVLFLTGFVILAIQSWTGYVNKLQRIIHDLEEELARQSKGRQSFRGKGHEADRLAENKIENRTDGNPEAERFPGSERRRKNPVEKGESKAEGNRAGMDPKNQIL